MFSINILLFHLHFAVNMQFIVQVLSAGAINRNGPSWEQKTGGLGYSDYTEFPGERDFNPM